MENYQISNLENSFQEFEKIINTKFKNHSSAQLNYKQNSESWSILECLAHLNLYSEYYNPEIKRVLAKAQNSSIPNKVKWSWFGKMSVKKIAVDNKQKMKTMARMNPVNSDLSPNVMEDFLRYNSELIHLTQRASTLNYNTKGVKVEFIKIIKMSLAETLLFMMEHQNRHLIQAQNVLEQIISKNSEGIEV